MTNSISDFLGFLMEGLKVCMYALTNIEFTIETNSFRLVDSLAYGAVIGSALRFISTRYKGSWRGDHKQINRNVGAREW